LTEYLTAIERNARTITIAVILCVFTAGLGYTIYLGASLRYPDEWVYFTFTQNLKHAGMFSLDGVNPSAAKAPGYSFVLWVVSFVSNTVLAMRLFNYLAFCLSLWILYLFVQKHSKPIVGLLSVILCILYPVLFYTASTLFPQTVGTTMFLLLLFLADRHPRLTVRSSVGIGILSGYLILTIPTFIFLIVVYFVWRLIFEHERLIMFVIMILGIILVNGLWTIRNYEVFHAIVLNTTDGGVNLLLGNNENTTPNAGVNADISLYQDVVIRNGMRAADADRFYRDQAVQWVVNHKLEAAKLYFLKFLNHFNFRNDLGTNSESSLLRDLIAGFTYLPLLAVFLVRLARFQRYKISKFEWSLILLYIAWGLIMAIFFTRVRYRLPLDHILIALDSLFIYRVITMWSGNADYNSYHQIITEP